MTAILTKKEAATLLRISLPTLDKLTRQGVFRRIKLGKKVMFAHADIAAGICALRQ